MGMQLGHGCKGRMRFNEQNHYFGLLDYIGNEVWCPASQPDFLSNTRSPPVVEVILLRAS